MSRPASTSRQLLGLADGAECQRAACNMSGIPVPKPGNRRGTGPGVIFRHAGSLHPSAAASQATLSSGRSRIEHPALRLEGISKEFSKIAPKRKADDLSHTLPQELVAQPMIKRTKASVPPAFSDAATGSSNGFIGSTGIRNEVRKKGKKKSIKKTRNRLRNAGGLNHVLLRSADQNEVPDPPSSSEEALSRHATKELSGASDGKSSRKSKKSAQQQQKNGRSATLPKTRSRRNGKAAAHDDDFEYGEEMSVISNGIHRKSSKSDMSDHGEGSSTNGISQRKKAQQARLTQEMQYSKQVTMFWSATEKMMQPVSEAEVRMLQGLTRRCRQSWLALAEER